MVMRKSQSDHDNMVVYAARFLMAKGFQNVQADLPGWSQPAKITWKNTGQGHIPDVTGDNDGQNLFEVETDDTINIDHTADQWRLFAAYADQHQAKFWVVVPQGSRPKTEARLRQLNLKASVWEVPLAVHA